ncbi:hypothetical protein WICMUC_001373 [Wickerhamomyces mucosus]|uniref:Major facilitator superfamily (MFS) profile domain-containing protein n=1 Tax=Wickerhamomyces mucosus TaxID=1378264 RepID=A0A9P8PWB6_9ASCO|nr:hypothetical protein WICMUC_001373 [Wickerhamomyces mucosus]
MGNNDKNEEGLHISQLEVTDSFQLQDFPNDEEEGEEDSFQIEDELYDLEHNSIENKLIHKNNVPLILFILWSGNFLTQLDGTIVSTTMSNIASDFNQSDLVTWIATSYLLTSTSFQPLFGKTSDILGRKTLLLIAQAFFTLGIFLSSISINIQTLALARAVAGVGGAGVFALSSIVITDLVSLSERSIYMGYGTIVASVSQMLGGPVGGWCMVTIGWRYMFLLQVPFLLLIMFLLTRIDIHVDHIPAPSVRYSKQNLKRIDYQGIILLNIIVSSLIFLLSIDDLSKFVQFLLVVIFIISSIGFYYVENYVVVEKVIDFEILKGIIGAFSFVHGVSTLGFYMSLFIVPLYLQTIQEIEVANIGYFMMFLVIATSVGSLFSGFIIRKHNKSELDTMKIGIASSFWFLIIQIIGYVGVFYLIVDTYPLSKSFSWKFNLISALVITGLGIGGFGIGIAIFVIGKVGKKGQASANTVVSLIKSLGNVLGVSISLSSYTNSIKFDLNQFFDDKDIVNKLIKDSNFIKDGLPQEYLEHVLNIYKDGLVKSFHPGLILSFIGIIVMALGYAKVRSWNRL